MVTVYLSEACHGKLQYMLSFTTINNSSSIGTLQNEMLNLLNFSIYIGTEDKEKKRLSKLKALVL